LCHWQLQAASCLSRYWYESGMEEVYMKELASFAAFQNHLKAVLDIDAAGQRWSPIAVTKQPGVNAVGMSSTDAAMLYLSAEGSVCSQSPPSHAAFPLQFQIADATWSAEWISTTNGLPSAPAFTITAKDGRGISGLSTPALLPDAVLVLKAVPGHV
jgi:hypothetical protein